MNQIISCPKCNTHIDFKRCRNCANYIPHYVRNSESQEHDLLEMGHCVYPRVKNRKADDVCHHWSARGKDTA